MKTRILAMLLTLAMVMGMVVAPAAALDVVTEAPEKCPHCNIPYDQCNWQALIVEEPSVTIPSGHYYLDEDLNTVDKYMIGTKEGQTQEYAVDVCLDLRGNTLTQTKSNNRAFSVYDYSTFAIMDSVGGGQIVGIGRTIKGGTIYACSNSQVDLYSGSLVNAITKRTVDGGVLFINKKATFNMHGGVVDGSKVGVTVILEDTENNVKGQYPRGAAMALSGEANIMDGLVLGSSTYQGGTISVNSTGALNVSGGTILGGKADSHGGNIYSQGIVNISGGKILGGYSGSRGGNVYSSGSGAELTISGGVIRDGQASSNGGNLSSYGGKVTISGGEIQGNVYLSVAATITGSPIISNSGYEGIQMVAGKILTLDGLTQGAQIVIRASGAFTDAATSPNAAQYLEAGYIIPASRYAVELTDGALVGSEDGTGYCPHCQQEITWEAYTADTTTSGHYYIPAGGITPNAAARNIAKGVDIVLNFAHGSVKTAEPYTVAGTLSMLSTATSIGSFTNSTGSHIGNGGTMTVTGTLNIYDAILRGCETSSSDARNEDGGFVDGYGGAVYLNGGTLNMHGGWIDGGTAYNGGAVYTNVAASTIHMHGGVIDGGTATGGGGNVYLYKGTFHLNDGLILGGSAAAAGNVYNNSGAKLYINGGIIALGTATDTGGNLRHAATSCVTEMSDGLLYGGTAPEGGNAYINNGKFTMTGGTILNGVATEGHSGNMYAHAGSYYINKGQTPTNWIKIGDTNTADNIPAPAIIGGKAVTLGGNINATGYLHLGRSVILGGDAASGKDLNLGDKAYLTVEPGFDQELTITITSKRVTELKNNRKLSNSVCTQMNGKLIVENYENVMLMQTEDNALGLPGASLVNAETQAQTWFYDAQSAVDAVADGQFVRLYAPQNTLALSKDTIVDFNGTNATVTGSGKLYGFDSANDDYDGYGTVTVTGATVEPVYQAYNGNRYVAVTDGTATSFHRLGIGISTVSLRPSIAGIYFNGTWQCDSVLEAMIDTFGVAVSVENMPGADFATDDDTLFTTFGAEEFVNGAPKTSVMIKNILVKGGENENRGSKPIYAAPYAKLTNGVLVFGDDSTGDEAGVCYTMKQVMRGVNRIWPRLQENQKEGVKKLYNVDVPVMESWDLYNITAEVNGTPVNRPLKVLTLGHSLAVDSGHMLNLIAHTQGYTDMTVSTLYYSGCPLYKHVNFLQNDLPEYSLYLSSTLTPDEPPTIIKGVTMKYGIEYADWDIIIMQGGVFEIGYSDKYTDGNIQIIQDYVNRYKTNPEAIFAWHMAWAPPTTNSLRDKYPYSPNSYYSSYEPFNDDRPTLYKAITGCVENHIATDDSFIFVDPAGTAIENALSSHLEETDLHRDYVHLSDLGRVISSYTWYCRLAGVEQLDEVKLDAIPKAFLKSTSDKTQDRVLTDVEKAIILEAVNAALANPYQMTQSQYTAAP